MHTRPTLWTRLVHGLCCLVLLLAAVAAPLSRTQPALAAPEFVGVTVDRSDDNNVSACTPAPDDCTLRGAINKVNGGVFTDQTILFSSTVTLIALSAPLPAIVVTGTWVIGSAGVPRVDGVLMAAGDVFSVSAPYAAINQLSIVNGRPLTDGLYSDIRIVGGVGIVIAGNYLGTLPANQGVSDCHPNPGGGSLVGHNSAFGIFVDQGVTGGTGLGNGSVYIYGNTVGCHGSHGIVLNGADYVHIGEDSSNTLAGNFIGANSAGTGLINGEGGIGDGIDLVAAGGSVGARYNTIRGNTIENNGRYGILLSGNGLNNSTSTYANVIAGNDIGIDFIGPYANGSDGIFLGNSSFFNIIGGTTNADRNIISGNQDSGIHLVNSNANAILGNYIGTSLSGTVTSLSAGANRSGQSPSSPNAARMSGPGNHQYGILLDSSNSNQIGGPTAPDRNVISGNILSGLRISASESNVVGFNLIGLDAAGTSALANGQDGVWISDGSTANTVGSVTVGEAQYIAGNTGSGVLIMNSSGNFVRVSNRIGVGPSGTPLGNGDGGVLVIDSANNTVDPTLVANNGGAGVAAVGTTSTGNFLRPFHVYGNTGLAVDLQNDGATPNDGDDDTGTGADNLLEYPVITASAGNVITGTVCALCTVFVYQAIGNPAAAGGGGDYLQQALADGTGHWTTTLGGGRTSQSVTLQAVSGLNTSEFSPRPILFLPLTVK